MFWIINSGHNSNLNLVWILMGLKPYGKNLINSQKIYFVMVFMTVNLEWLTCIQKAKVSLQVAIRTWFNNNQKKGFEFEFKLKPSNIIDYTVEVL
jgi:hypothetical protein